MPHLGHDTVRTVLAKGRAADLDGGLVAAIGVVVQPFAFRQRLQALRIDELWNDVAMRRRRSGKKKR